MKRKTWIIILFVAVLAAIVLLTIWYYASKQSQFVKSDIPPAGPCITVKPASGKYVHVKMSFKAKDIAVRYFTWNGIDYARHCFPFDNDATHKFDGYVPDYPNSTIPLEVTIRSQQNQNEVEYNIQVLNLKDSVLFRFPADGSNAKKIANLSGPLIIKQTIPAHQ